MYQLIDPTWWLSLFPQLATWWLVCLVASLLAWPLCLVFFRGLPDRGASLASGLGLVLLLFLGWVTSLEWFTGGGRVALLRLVILVMAVGAVLVALWMRQRNMLYGHGKQTAFIPAAILVFLALISVPHGFLSGFMGILMLAGLAIVFWAHRPEEFFKSIRLTAVPFIIGQVLFLLGLLFFANVRSYLPWATFEIGLHAAEKWGNYTHLHALMRTNSFPPPDLWFQGEPINYYYGGHLLTATIAKLSGVPVRIAFNLGLATIFGLTLALGFGFTYALVHTVAPRIRLGRRVFWQGGMAWGLVGALAIGMFGNLDAWRQLWTRDVDSGVRHRMEQERLLEQEEWKLRAGIPAETGLALWAATTGSQPWDRTGNLFSRLSQSINNNENPVPKVMEIARQVDDHVERGINDTRVTRRALADRVIGAFTSAEATQALRQLPGINAIEFQEELFRLCLNGEFEEVGTRLRAAAENTPEGDDWLNRAHTSVGDRMVAALTGDAMTRLVEGIGEHAGSGSELATAAKEVEIRLQNAMEGGEYTLAAREMATLASLARSDDGHDAVEDRSLRGLVLRAENGFRWEPLPWLESQLGGAPPPSLSQPDIKDIRYSWYNITQIDFWASSRAIKGTPPGVREAGTITEFPYFSAILGDHHPHHFAIPWFLLALCGCLSLLRKTMRLGWTDRDFFCLTWPELLTMAFMIGTVFAVNIWDAVVLAPLYAVVILVARRGVTPAEWWRWVGFVGFLVLLSLIVGVLYNSIPGRAPLFQNFKFFLLAIMAICPGFMILRWLVPTLAPWKTIPICIGASLLAIIVGSLLSPGEGGPVPVGQGAIALRDLSFFIVIVGIAASWTLLGRSPAT
ncbi:MAG: hypothetical protein JJU11_13780, partial [Candidatus Sumerlaeia bacterium]|nr:hypothetical protein [Candidatus Sumerlaeia bacterium]